MNSEEPPTETSNDSSKDAAGSSSRESELQSHPQPGIDMDFIKSFLNTEEDKNNIEKYIYLYLYLYCQ